MLHIEEYVGIILGGSRTRRARALADPDQSHVAFIEELARYIEAHHPEAEDVTVVSVTDTGQIEQSQGRLRRWYRVAYQA
ncbi:hypothetical protein A5647_13730 [Mycobacterium sp. 1100029.7]|nr:hypothetical protein A5647_13730 [Mycobacterium sp. 1100029.7]